MTPAQKFQTSQSHLEQKEHSRVHYRLTRCPFPLPKVRSSPTWKHAVSLKARVYRMPCCIMGIPSLPLMAMEEAHYPP